MNIKLTIDRFEKNFAVLKAEDGQNINWPKNKLQDGVREGNVLTFLIISQQEKTDDQKKLAKNVLNEILDVD